MRRASRRSPRISTTRLDALPRYRQHLSEQRTGGLSWPRWEDVPSFDVRTHIHRAGLPAPGGKAELLEWAGTYFGERLDRSRPLWELVVLEGLEDGRWALASKTHHCMVDGVGSVDASSMLFDTEPGDGAAHEEAATGSAIPPPQIPVGKSSLDVVTGGLAGIVRLPVQAGRAGLGMVGAGLGVARHPSRGIDALKRSRALAELIVKDEINAAPHSSINVPIGAHRELAVVTVPIDELKAIKNALGGKLNDVVLAASAGGLRTLLLSRGETPPEPGLRAMVPVNVRADQRAACPRQQGQLAVRRAAGRRAGPAAPLPAPDDHDRVPQGERPGDRIPDADRLHRPRSAGPAQLRGALDVRDASLQRDDHQRPRTADRTSMRSGRRSRRSGRSSRSRPSTRSASPSSATAAISASA